MSGELCDAEVIREGCAEPCERLAVTYREDTIFGEGIYPVCRRHAGPSALGVVLEQTPQLDDLAFAPVWMHVMARWSA